MRLRATAFISLAFALFMAGCSNGGPSGGAGIGVGSGNTQAFGKTADQIRPGMSKNDVTHALGKPDVREMGVAGVPVTGAQPPVTIPAGSRYEHWIYARDGSEYHVFFGASAVHIGQWEVLSTSANPISAAPVR